jgi:eukaryotic-like serine/threonine-protein kinase
MDPDQATANPAHPLIGQIVGGRYQIVGLIGEGGMGVVYKAEQRLGSTVRKVAVKTLHAELSRDPSITARFHREVGTVAQLEHPNTVRVYDFGSTDDGTLYIAMEFLDGRALNRVIETEGALEPRRVGNLIRQIAGSLDEAHRQGIIHRDLKPENVLLIERAGEKDVVKLVDFGIAARTESADREKEQKLTQQGMVLGTPPYMSPEQFTGKPLDARSDVYSLGIMAYEMLTGQLPFQADTPWQWATHHMTSQPRAFDEIPNGARIPESLRRTVLRALSKDPNERQDTAGQFNAEFSAGLASVGSAAPPRVNAGGKTEAMAQPPPLAMAATEHMAIPVNAGKKTAPAMAAAAAVLPPAPPREQANKGRGIQYALAGLAVVLFVAMGVAALRSGSDEDTPPPPLDLGPTAEVGGTSATGNTAPEVTPEPDPLPEVEPPDEPKPRPKPASGTTKPAATKPTTPPAVPPTTPTPPAPTPQAPVPQIPVPVPTPPVAQPTPPAPAPGADPCNACAKAAQSGDINTAVALYGQCTNAAGKRQCTQATGPKTPKAAERAAFNGQCAQARLIIAAGQDMGVPAARFDKAKNACK